MKIGKGGRDINEYDGIKFVNTIKLLGLYFSNYESARNLDVNWESKIENLEKILSLWSKRYLTLFGKVTIIKTFGISQFIYVMKSVGLNKPVLDKINKMLYSFIWGKDFKNINTFEKIRRTTLCKDIEEGGLSMIDMIDMQNTFYIKWALKLYTQCQQRWAALPMNLLRLVGGETVFLCDVNVKSFRGYENIKSEFWKEVIRKWLELEGSKLILGTEDLNIKHMPICNNKNVTYKGKTIYIPEIISKGIICIRDFLEEEQSLISFENLVYKIGGYPKIILHHKLICNSLIGDKYTNQEETDTHSKEAALQAFNSSNNVLRKLIKKVDNREDVGHAFWNRKFQEDVLPRYAESILSTKEIKLKELLFKIYHNIYPTKVQLEKMKKEDNNKCDYCGEIDFIEHAFTDCQRIKVFWNQVLEWIKKELDIHIPVDAMKQLFGIVRGEGFMYKGKSTNKANHILIIAKFAIIKSKYYDGENVKGVFETEIKKRLHYLRN